MSVKSDVGVNGVLVVRHIVQVLGMSVRCVSMSTEWLDSDTIPVGGAQCGTASTAVQKNIQVTR